MGTLRILTADGGGIRGKISARIFRDLEKDIGPLHKHFHFMAGTSANALNLTALSAVQDQPILSADALDGLYTSKGPAIFDRSLTRKFTTLNGLVLNSKYSPENLQSIVDHVFTDTALSDVSSRLMVTAYDVENRKPVVFKSWEAAGLKDTSGDIIVYDPAKDFMLSDVVMSSAAAPTYFPPHTTHNMDGAINTMIDGGVWANNPAQVALAEARSIFGDVHDFLVVSVGTGETERRVQAQDHQDWSISGWLRNGLVSLLMDAPTSAIDKQMREERNVSYHRLQMDLKRREADKPAPNDDLDDSSPENIARLEERADEFLHNNKDYMCKLKNYFSYHALPNYQELLEEANWAAKKREERRDPIMDLPPREEFYDAAPP